MRTHLKAFMIAVGLLPVLAAPLHSQEAESPWMPDMTGVWTSTISGYGYLDVTDPASVPVYIDGSLDYDLVITHQSGNTFAGTVNGRKLAGVVLPDRTVSIQYYEPSQERHFITGRLVSSGGTLQISGYMHFFDLPNPEGNDAMATVHVRLVKANTKD